MKRTIFTRLSALAWLAGAVLAVAALAPQRVVAQEVPEPFAALHQRLDSTADRLLASPQEAAPVAVEGAPASLLQETGVTEAGIEQFAQQHWKGRLDGLRQALERVQALRPALEARLREERVPAELVAVALVESAGQRSALSPSGARGLWQFMPRTARRYGLQVTARTDERLDVEKSSRAAARHLRELHELFGDWSLALAAYNAGDGAVQKAVRRGRTKDFARLSELRLLPAETRAYVPAVLAAARLFAGAALRPTEPGRDRREIIRYATPAGVEDAPGEQSTAGPPATLIGLRGQKMRQVEARD